MDLMNAPAFDEGREKRKRNLLIGGVGLVFAIVILTLVGYISGHGWLFLNLPVEHRVNTFFNALEAKDYSKAYGIYNNDADWQQHPDKYTKDYSLQRFTEDWTTDSPMKGPVLAHHVDISRTEGDGNGSGTIVAVRVKPCKTLFMRVSKKDGTMTWPAQHEILYDSPCL